MRLTVVGCGDAFGSGGRLQTCFHVETASRRFLIDCGATALIGLDRLRIDPNEIDTILVSHLHGDHFGGLVWWMLHAHHVSRRQSALTVAGPPGLADRFAIAAEALFPGSTAIARRFALNFIELATGAATPVDGLSITPFTVVHPSGAPSYALRIEVDGKIVSFSGDTEWTDNLLPCARGADLFIVECYGYDVDVRYHMNWRTIEANRARLAARRVMLTHMNQDMLARRTEAASPSMLVAEDGLVVDI